MAKRKTEVVVNAADTTADGNVISMGSAAPDLVTSETTSAVTTKFKGKAHGKKAGVSGSSDPGSVTHYTWVGKGVVCWNAADGSKMIDYDGQSHVVYRVSDHNPDDGSRFVYKLTSLEDGTDCPHAIGILSADAPVNPWAVVESKPKVKSRGKKADIASLTVGAGGGDLNPGDENGLSATLAAQSSMQKTLPNSVAPVPMMMAAALTLEDRVAKALETLQPIRRGCRLSLDMMDRTNQALHYSAVNLVEWMNSIPEDVLAEIIKKELGQDYNTELKFSQVARLGFGLRNEPVTDQASRHRNKSINSATYRIAKGLRRIADAFSKLALSGEPASSEFIVKLLVEPGSGGLSGAGSLLYPDNDTGGENTDTDGTHSSQASTGSSGTGTGSNSGAEPDSPADDDEDDGDGFDDDDDAESASGAPPKPKTKPRTKSTALDSKRFLSLPELILPAQYSVPGSVFVGALRTDAEGKPVLVAAADLSTAIARVLLPTTKTTTVDDGSKFISGLLMLSHFVIGQPKIVLISDGKLNKALLATESSAGSVLISATPAVEIPLPFTGAGVFDGLDLKRPDFSLITKVKKGEASLLVSAENENGRLCGLGLVAGGAAGMSIDVKQYGVNSTIGEIDPNLVNAKSILSAEQTSKLWDRLKVSASVKECSEYLCCQFNSSGFSNVSIKSTSDAGWNSSQYFNDLAFFVWLPDLVRIYKATKRLDSNAVPIIRADPSGILIVDLKMPYGTYSIGVPSVYPGTGKRRSEFCRQFVSLVANHGEDEQS